MRLFAGSTIDALKHHSAPNRPKHADWQRLIARVDAWCAAAAEIPSQSGGWIHNYICPTHWLPIAYVGDSQLHHCPAGHTVEGSKFDEAWLAWRHRQFADTAREVALAYVVTGQANYLAEVERVLLAYADFYANFEGADSAESWMLTARVFNQALTESLWAIPLIHAFDLVSADLDATIRQQIERDFLRPLAGTISQAQDALIAKDDVHHNYMTWFNAALGCLGYTLEDAELIERAIDGAGGFINNLSAGVLPDGMQYEVTPYYHNFVVLAYVILAEAAAANGRDLYAVRGATEKQSIIGMCEALTQTLLPDGRTADLGDGSYWIDSVYDRELIEVYEIAASHRPDFSSFKTMLTYAYARSQRERDGWAALLFGAESITPQPQTINPQPQHLPDAGVTILRASPELAAVALFGAFRGSHSHGDQLSLQVWPFSNDAGCVLYGISARRDWYQDSYAHNSLVIDGQTQRQFSQATHTLGQIVNSHMLSLQSTDAYGRCKVLRRIYTGENRLEDVINVYADAALAKKSSIFHITGDSHPNSSIAEAVDKPAPKDHTFDYVFHVDGELLLTNLATETIDEPVGASVAAQQIFLVEKAIDVNSAEFTITHAGETYNLTLIGKEPFDLLLGTAPGTSWDPTQRRRVIIGRTIGQSQSYSMTITHD